MRLVKERLLNRSGLGWVDPDFPRERARLRGAGGEAFRVRGVGRGEHDGARGDPLLGPAVVHVSGRQQPEADVVMLGVVPREEDLAVRSSVLDRAEARRERRAVLERLELRFRERVVVRDARPRVGPRHAQSACKRATGLEVIAEPRSAWMVSCPRSMPWRAQLSCKNRSASEALSRWATIQPTT